MEQLPETLPDSPLPLICRWLHDAVADGSLQNPDAMTLATVDASGQPGARVVLCKDIVADPGYLVFYTNYESAKGAAIEAGNRVAAVFHWDHMDRQVRIEGFALQSPAEESDDYFASRDKESQIGAWASNQSEPIDSRQKLLNKHAATARKLSGLAIDSGIMDIPRPPFWGGYRIWISAAELWVRGQARLHDRGRWERSLDLENPANPKPGAWTAVRLQP
ncbi:MAG: pyridoxamine 5'-phosphate oxidase [Gammaproteobacteria bacterium]|nr:pyridoxamine 5'-phosphate oxidase [Gammaproteobacteria bacterium]